MVAINGEEIVIVEVKSTLDKGDVDRFIEKLKVFKKGIPDYADKTVYGAVAFLGVSKGADEYAEEQGIFIIKAPGGSATVSTIANGEAFSPKSF